MSTAQPRREQEQLTHEDLEEFDTQCGIGPCRGIKCLQMFANKKVYVFIYGMLGFVYSAAYAYSTATLSTLEKRFKMPSRMTGLISVGNDISSIFATMLLSYYLGKGHRPRWIAAGIYSVALYCFLKLLPHVLWGAGEDALALTVEHGGSQNEDFTAEVILTQKRKTLCRAGLNDSLAGAECEGGGIVEPLDAGILPVLILFFANFVSGIGGSLYWTLGVSYMDDNIKKSKTPFLISVSYFLRTLGPAFGYAMGSFFLKIYISPSLTPTITNKDPRWLGAWWAGWWILGGLLTFLGTLIGMFPRTLPRTVQRRREALALRKTEEQPLQTPQPAKQVEDKASLKDMKRTIARLLTNKTYMCNTLASVFYMFGFMPFWVFMPKYLEFQYRITASQASFYTGTAGLVCSALGVLIAGLVITWVKPTARYLAGWNVIVSVVSVVAIVTYRFLGCQQSDLQSVQMKVEVVQECNLACRCEFVKYSPVCSEDGRTTFISACHAGCTDYVMENGKKVFVGCTCIPGEISSVRTWPDVPLNLTHVPTPAAMLQAPPEPGQDSEGEREFMRGGRATPGPCPVDCMYKFFVFIAFMCLLKFSGAAGRASNFLVSVRCVEEKDKPTSMGFGMLIFNITVFIPSPIIFGYIIDSTCVVWGKTCSGKGNCWQYDGEEMRVLLNFTAATFVTIGTLFDVGVWYYVKNLRIFDDDEEGKEGTKKVADPDTEPGRELVEVHAPETANHVQGHNHVLENNKGEEISR